MISRNRTAQGSQDENANVNVNANAKRKTQNPECSEYRNARDARDLIGVSPSWHKQDLLNQRNKPSESEFGYYVLYVVRR